jgi:hypothetical protein
MDSMTAQTTAQAYWARQYRKRRRAGIRVYELELPEIEVAEGLKRRREKIRFSGQQRGKQRVNLRDPKENPGAMAGVAAA